MSRVDVASGLPVEDTLGPRSGLIGWGVFLIVIGTLAALGATIVVFEWVGQLEQSLLGRIAPRRSGGPPVPVIGFDDVLGALLGLAATCGIAWTGIACCLARRWVRPVVMAGAVLVMVVGALTVITLLLLLPSVLDALDAAAARRSPGLFPATYSVIALFLIRAGVLLALAVALPYVLFRFFRSDRTARALDLLDPRVTWADRCPAPVLGWAGYCGLVGVATVLRASEPALPAFVVVLRGAPAIVGLVVLAVLLAWGAWLCYRMDRLGWVVTFVLLVALRTSAAVYLWTGGDVADLTADAGASAQLARMQKVGVPPDWLPPVIATLDAAIVAGFGLYVASHFPAGYRVALAPTRAPSPPPPAS